MGMSDNPLFDRFGTCSWQALVGSLKITLRSHLESLDGIGDDGLDVRLCMRKDGSWFLNTGDVQYDTEHTAYCGAGCIGKMDTEADLKIAALDLIKQVDEQIAEDES